MQATLITALACASGAAAFVAPSSFNGVAVANSVKSSTTLSMSEIKPLENMSGATSPVPYWDPLGFASKVDNQELQKYREAELKHGRVAMLAALGMIVQENFHPFFNTAGLDIGPAAFHLQKTMEEFSYLPFALVLGVGLVELTTINKGWSKQDFKETGLGAGFVANLKEDYFPGDLGFDPLGLYPSSPEARTSIRNKELNNGRLAMIAIWGMWAQELVDGLPLAEHYARFGFGPAQ
ncbi:light harvesting complex protein [Tribonema minus]|uniref:Light harvesting complex protein n=1 Tax=Tribonema minus TaxID=303371 RepID=A0A835YNQ1_9STRA|nr:light harvesting complex protein [Tribonema minus]